MNARNNSPKLTGPLTVVGVALVAVLCCVGPILIAGGALTVLGTVVRSGWLMVIGALVLLGVLVYTARHRAHRYTRQHGVSRGE